MEAIEFKSKIKGNQILIPPKVQSKLKLRKDENVRIIVLIDDISEEISLRDTVKKQFLQGYSDTDAIYDQN